ncbi:MAG: Sec-independent protein secretion pathway component TatC [uncultured archaeon A07HR60]|nr:MAG: Sec-independent protein secretion pathway component TatC [uncultured archaeon A07HR60]
MASALDEDTRGTLAEGEQTARAVLRAAQKDLQKVFIVFLVGFIGTFYALRLYVWEFLKNVTSANMPQYIKEELSIIAQTPFEVILLQAKIGLVVGIIVGLPALLYFARDALRDRGLLPQTPLARWKMAAIGLLSVSLLSVGVAYGYLVFFPVMFSFLAGFGLEAGFNPSYSIVMWTEFIVFLSLSFGLAGQMPLLVTGLSYGGIVQYETFRDKWRYAVLAIVIFGAMFSPPDPFTQIMWAIPLIVLYGFSLYLAKVVVTTKRGSEQIDLFGAVRANWNVVAGSVGTGAAATYVFYAYGGRSTINQGFAALGSGRRILAPGEGLISDPTLALASHAAATALVVGLLAVLYAVYTSLEVDPRGRYGDPTAIDLSELDRGGITAAPDQAFEALAEEEALALAQEAIDEDDPDRAQAILDRFDAAQADEAEQVADEDAPAADGAASESEDAPAVTSASSTTAGGPAETVENVGDRASRAGSTFMSELTEDTDEDDIGGYYTDLKFIFDSIRSRSFRIVIAFLLAMAGTFTWMYLGGLGDVRTDFTSRLPAAVDPGDFTVITLHPVEALVFMVKASVLVGFLAVLPMLTYYAWPGLRDRGWVRGHRRQVFAWTGALTAGLVGGFALGYSLIAPGMISYLVADALQAEMLVTYRINDFFWLIIFTTAGIGILADIPVLLVLLNSAGVPYTALRGRWREVTIALLTLAALLTPADIITMFLVTVPLMIAYGLGLAVLYTVTFGGRRDLAPPAKILDVDVSASDSD